jgi:hypothetical protein
MPDFSLVEPPNITGPDFVAACRAPDARYALIYVPSGKPVSLRVFLLNGARVSAQWYDPRTGVFHEPTTIDLLPWKTALFIPPSVNDWVLVLTSS